MDWGQGVLTDTIFIFVINAILILGGMVSLWVINVLIKNMGIVDIGWGLGFFLVALTTSILGPGDPLRKLALTLLIGLWSFRLTTYLFLRFIKKKEEDRRYLRLRHQWTQSTELKILLMFIFQGLLILIISLPFLAISFDPRPLQLLDFFGIFLSLAAIFGEALSDWQLKKFLSKPENRGQVCRVGLWNKSRHPNYFFEWIFWLGVALFAIEAPFGLTGVLSCGLMLIILLFLSTPITESELAKSKKEAYTKYQKEVPGFIPKLW